MANAGVFNRRYLTCHADIGNFIGPSRRSAYKIVKCVAGFKKLEKVDSDVCDVMKEDITLSFKDVIVGVSAW